MFGRLDGRHRPPHISSREPVAIDDPATAASPHQRGSATSIGAFAGRNAFAGAAVLAGVATGPSHTPDVLLALMAFPWIGFLRLGRAAVGTLAVDRRLLT